MVSLLDSAGIELTESQGFVNDLSQPLAKLVEKDVRIILASFNATWARRVFCEVFRTDLYGRRYQWIITGPRQDFWWREEDLTVNCSAYEILAALEGAFVVDVLPLTSSKEKTISGLVSFIFDIRSKISIMQRISVFLLILRYTYVTLSVFIFRVNITDDHVLYYVQQLKATSFTLIATMRMTKNYIFALLVVILMVNEPISHFDAYSRVCMDYEIKS